MEDLLKSQPGLQPPSLDMAEVSSHQSPLMDLGHQDLLTRFSELLEQGLVRKLVQITANIKADIQELSA